MTSTTNTTLESRRASKTLTWVGRVISALPALFMLVTGIMTLVNPAPMTEGMKHYGYPEHAGRKLIVVELVCVVLYLVSQTAVLGAILLTGYLGGAVATHVRVSEMPTFAVIVAVLLWLGLLLRDRRLWSLLPLRQLPGHDTKRAAR